MTPEKEGYLPLTIRLKKAQRLRLRKLLQNDFGMQNIIFEQLVDQLIEKLEEDHDAVLRAVALRTLILEDFYLKPERKDNPDG